MVQLTETSALHLLHRLFFLPGCRPDKTVQMLTSPPTSVCSPPTQPPRLCRSRPGLHRLPQGCNHDAFSYSLGGSLLHHAAAARPRQSGDIYEKNKHTTHEDKLSLYWLTSCLCFLSVCGGGRTNHITGGSVSILPKEGLPQRGFHRYHLLPQLPDWTHHGYQGNATMKQAGRTDAKRLHRTPLLPV